MFLLTCIIGLLGWILVIIQTNKLNKLKQKDFVELVKVENKKPISNTIDISDWKLKDQVTLKYEYWSKLNLYSTMYIIDIFPDNTIAVGDGGKKGIVPAIAVEYNQSARNREVENKMLDNNDYKQALLELQAQFYN